MPTKDNEMGLYLHKQVFPNDFLNDNINTKNL